MIVCLRLDGFYAKRFPSDGRPLVVVRDKTVLDCDGAAQNRGVAVGMSQREAKAILYDGRFEPWNEDDHRQAQLQWLDVCCEFSDGIEPIDQHRAFVDLSLHPDPMGILARMRARLAEATGCRIAAGCARVKWLAEAALEEGDDGRAYTDPAGFLAGLPVMRLCPVPVEHRQRLQMLGYLSAGDAAKLSIGVLQSQFGNAAVTIRRCLQGGCSEPVRPAYPPRCLSTRFYFDEPTDSLETIDRALVRMADQLGKRLAEDDLQGCDLHAVVLQEEGERRVERRYAKPIGGAASLLFCLRRLVGECAPDPSAGRWTAIRVRMPNLEQARRKQAGLYTWRATDQRQAAEQTIAQLHRAFGLDSVVLASNVVEPRRKRLMKVWEDAIGWS